MLMKLTAVEKQFYPAQILKSVMIHQSTLVRLNFPEISSEISERVCQKLK